MQYTAVQMNTYTTILIIGQGTLNLAPLPSPVSLVLSAVPRFFIMPICSSHLYDEGHKDNRRHSMAHEGRDGHGHRHHLHQKDESVVL